MVNTKILAALQERYAGRKRTMQSLSELLARLGHPERAYPCLHLAGTNGKGSVAAMLESMLRAKGLHTGRFTSPALLSIHERIALDGQCIGDALMERCAETVLDEERLLGARLTAFDRLTLTALLAFAQANVDIAVLECGMGGRLDSTNIVTPLVSVLTSIGMDHTQYLGADIQSIAEEKCGIIKQGIPVVCASQPPEVMDIIRRVCQTQHAPLVCAGSLGLRSGKSDITGQTLYFAGGECRLPLAGAHQADNAAAAISAALQLPERIRPDMRAIRAGLESVSWPGRLEWLPRSSTGLKADILLDGAHNAQGAEALANALTELLPGRKLVLLCAIAQDKDADSMARQFARFAHEAVATATDERMHAPETVQSVLQGAGMRCNAETDPDAALQRALALASGGVVVVAGSLYLAGAVKGMLMKMI